MEGSKSGFVNRALRAGSLAAAAASALAGATCGPRIPPASSDGDSSTAGHLEAGMQAPDFTLVDYEGKAVALASLRGKVVVLYFYPKDETPGCTKEACSFRDNHEKFEALGAAILGVSLDSTESHAKFVKSQRLNFPLLSDPDGKVHSAYGAWKKGATKVSAFSVDRCTFVIDREGVVSKVWHDVKVQGHADEVLAHVAALPPPSTDASPLVPAP